MDTILNYLENMFSNLPQTEEVLRAKSELASMMEDKYNELLAEGKIDNEAVGIVISEFGNLKELSAELGINDIYEEKSEKPQGRFVGDTEARNYLSRTKKSSVGIGVGVMLCIFSPICLLILGGMQDSGYAVTDTHLVALGLGLLLALIAVAVGFFIYNGIILDKYEYMKKETIVLNEATHAYVQSCKDKEENSFLVRIIAGVVLCILGIIPLLVVGVAFEDNDFYAGLAVSAFLFIVGIAVFLFITAGMRREALQALLQEGDFSVEKKQNAKIGDKIGGIYWPVITCIYLAWSFITNDWGISWIIWPIAGVFFAVIMGICNAVKADSK